MPAAVGSLVLDLLRMIGPTAGPREVLDAWRTSCPRLPVWEEASDRGFIARRNEPARGAVVFVTRAGAAHLRSERRARAS
jgi:D-3-phosphoglycerate dehydrogenase